MKRAWWAWVQSRVPTYRMEMECGHCIPGMVTVAKINPSSPKEHWAFCSPCQDSQRVLQVESEGRVERFTALFAQYSHVQFLQRRSGETKATNQGSGSTPGSCRLPRPDAN